MTNEETTMALEGFQAVQPPANLYRFYSGSGLNALVDGTLKITPPEKLNDPFEMSPGIDVSSLTEEAMRRAFLSVNGLPRTVMLMSRDAPLELREMPDEVYQNWVETVIKRRDHWPEHLFAMRRGLTHAISLNYGVSCFSAFPEDVLNGPMGIRHWAMYAEDHRGFCIEYDGRHTFFQDFAASKWLFPVRYCTERPTFGIEEFNDWPQRKYLEILRRWSEMKCRQAWGDEKEWRLICSLTPDERAPVEISISGELHLLHIWRTHQAPEERANSTAIKRVILGVRASEDLENAVKNAQKLPHLRHVEIYRARMCERHFALRNELVPTGN